MNVSMLGVMLFVSLLLGLTGLIAFVWGLRTGQFDDEKKMMKGILYDNPEDLNEAAEAEKKRKEAEARRDARKEHEKEEKQ